ncbi:hypothetical protein F2P44_07115 [Massilia sp. CCM 8695]|uniref:Uncharacterized protein n=1 Tax=Massilia frigida TaxID=2609281 RepID=A0ABX0NF10_9BURK|nr:hypothetical protein [Massilia frigida]NHZ79045.1 hypothetical protein [Massilia frigida]
MNQFKYIYQRHDGATCFDRYFAYLGTIQQDMPPALASFSMDPDRYALNSDVTLHDSWLESLNVEKEYVGTEQGPSTVKLKLLHSSHESVINLVYTDVLGMNSSLQPSQWPLQPADLLVHEFCMLEAGIFRHFIEFDRDMWVEILFRSFDFTVLSRH